MICRGDRRLSAATRNGSGRRHEERERDEDRRQTSCAQASHANFGPPGPFAEASAPGFGAARICPMILGSWCAPMRHL